MKGDVYRLFEVFDIPEEITCYNRSDFSRLKAFYVFLKRFAYSCHYSDLVPRFGKSVPEIGMMSNYVMNTLHEKFNHLLHSFNQPLLSQQNLELYAHAVYDTGAGLRNCWGFVDGTVHSICRRNERIRRILYNGHKWVHALKFHSLPTISGLKASLSGPVELRMHDSGMLAESNLLPLLQQECHRVNGFLCCIYGDAAYPLRSHLQRPFESNHLPHEQKDFNKSIKTVHLSVEWLFKEVIR